MISIRNVSYQHESSNSRALDDVSIEIAEESFTAVMGANGSGKSTLARCLNGLLLPTTGDVLVDGVNTKNPGALRGIRRSVGLVFQDPNLQMTSATVERELAFGLQNIGLPIKSIREKVEDELHRLNLLESRSSAPSTLSGGEKQRLALASILVLEPKYLVLDEPTSFLSPASRKKVLEQLLELQKVKKIAVILVTQFLAEAMHAERLIVLSKSQVAFDDVPKQFLRETGKAASLGISVPANIQPFA